MRVWTPTELFFSLYVVNVGFLRLRLPSARKSDSLIAEALSSPLLVLGSYKETYLGESGALLNQHVTGEHSDTDYGCLARAN